MINSMLVIGLMSDGHKFISITNGRMEETMITKAKKEKGGGGGMKARGGKNKDRERERERERERGRRWSKKEKVDEKEE